MEKVTGPSAPNPPLMQRESQSAESWGCFESLKDAVVVPITDLATDLPPDWAQERWEKIGSNPCTYRNKYIVDSGPCSICPCGCGCGCLLCPMACPMALGSGAACALGRAVTMAEGEDEDCCGLCCGLGEAGRAVCCRVCCPIALTGACGPCSWLAWKMAMAQRKALIKEYSLRESPHVQFCCYPCEMWRALVFMHEVQQKAAVWRHKHKSFEIEERAVSTDDGAASRKTKGDASRKSRKLDASFLATSHLADDRPRSNREHHEPELETQDSVTL